MRKRCSRLGWGAGCLTPRRAAARSRVRAGRSGLVRPHQPGVDLAGSGHGARRIGGAHRHLRSLRSGVRRRVRDRPVAAALGARSGDHEDDRRGRSGLAAGRACGGWARARCSSARSIGRSRRSISCCSPASARPCVLDFADVPLAGLRRVPLTTWMRLQRIVEGTDIACLLMGPVPLTRSAGGVTVRPQVRGPVRRHGRIGAVCRGNGALQRPAVSERQRVERWAGEHDRSRRLAGLSVGVRVSSPRQAVQGRVAIETTTRRDAWAVD